MKLSRNYDVTTWSCFSFPVGLTLAGKSSSIRSVFDNVSTTATAKQSPIMLLVVRNLSLYQKDYMEIKGSAKSIKVESFSIDLT